MRGGPVGPRNAVVVGAWWLLREVELANLLAGLATLNPGSAPTLTLSLPATKTDTAAHGSLGATPAFAQALRARTARSTPGGASS